MSTIYYFARLVLFPDPLDRSRGWLMAGPMRIRCAIGGGGVVAGKREGDGGTPHATMRLGRGHWRPDRGPRPRTGLALRALKAGDGWCDAPADRNYNRPVRLPYPASSERMMRDDHLYDLVVELSWNLRPRIRGRGSAIFLHAARKGWGPTEGCVALRPADLRRLLARVGPQTRLVVTRAGAPAGGPRRSPSRPAHRSPRRRSPS
jgi:L,D-peptidoglycan transpeptidase YkuD (ErfK/YbiS/YcfS/YnhG family)